MTFSRRTRTRAIKETERLTEFEKGLSENTSRKKIYKQQDPSTIPVTYKQKSTDSNEDSTSKKNRKSRAGKRLLLRVHGYRRTRQTSGDINHSSESENYRNLLDENAATDTITKKNEESFPRDPAEPITTSEKEYPKTIRSHLKPAETAPYELRFSGKGQYLPPARNIDGENLISLPSELERSTQLTNEEDDIHDVTIGLDFGTSTVKVIVGDATIEKSFAVPFRLAPGLARYLLPCRLWETRDRHGYKFLLTEGKESFDDLKLSVLADPSNERNIIQAIGFIALVLRHVRAWLFSEHNDIYRYANIYWTVAIGLPLESQINGALTSVFNRIVNLAWQVSLEPAVRRTLIKNLLKTDKNTFDDISVEVMPELAAQIHGFVSSPSTSFDPRGENRYAIVDVGAGTVDSSVFRVEYKKGLWNFEYYTAVVQPNGVVNLHSCRIDWWIRALSPIRRARPMINDMRLDKFRSDLVQAIPECYEDYVKNVSIISREKFEDPDEKFFVTRLLRQIKGQTIFRCYKDKLLGQNDIKGMPIFLCGGGSRMEFYDRLLSELASTPNITWLRLVPRVLTLPTDLICEGVDESDYDRLSVAYGLSRLHMGEISTVLPLPEEEDDQRLSYRDRYIDKDML